VPRARQRQHCAWRRPMSGPEWVASISKYQINTALTAAVWYPGGDEPLPVRVAADLCPQAATVRDDVQRAALPRLHAAQAEPGTCAESLRCSLADSATFSFPRQVALCFLVRHAAHHDAIWRAWLASAAGLLPATAVHAACCAAAPPRTRRRALLQEVSAASLSLSRVHTYHSCRGRVTGGGR